MNSDRPNTSDFENEPPGEPFEEKLGEHPEEGRLQAYLDRALDPQTRASVQAHLQDCESCRTNLEALQRVVLDLESLPDLAPGQDLAPLVMERLRREQSPSSWWFWLAAAETAAAALILILSAPRLQNLFRELSLLDLGRSAVEQAAAYTARLTAGWLGWWADLKSLAEIPMPSYTEHILPDFGPGLGMILALGLAAGMLANALLLRGQTHPEKN